MKTINKKYQNSTDLKKFIISNNIKNCENILLQIFTGICDIDFIENLISIIKSLVPHIKIIGATTSGEICNGKVFENSTILSFSLFDSTKIKTYHTSIGKNSNQTAQNLISQFANKAVPKVAISFADGLTVNGEEFLNTFNDYSKDLIVAGGLAGDNANFIKTITFTEDRILDRGAVVALLFNDDLIVKTKASFGWENIGKTMTITKSKQNIVYEIDGIKAVDIYAKYLGDDIALHLPKVGIEFPLIVKKDFLRIPRAIIAKGNDGSLTFAGNLNIGDEVTFGYGNIDAILDYSDHLGWTNGSINSESIFIYSCMARKSLMQESIQIELKPLSKIAQLSGFFTYGEFFTDTATSNYELLNQTMTILSLSENNKKINMKLSKQNGANTRNKKETNLTLKAFSHLIHQTSLELEEINQTLVNKVQEEVKKNRRKDHQIIQQSRLAQMGEMMSMIAHQWRQPLAAISSTSVSINLKAQLNTLDNKNAIELTNKISQYAQHLSSTIDDFRDFFKSNKEKREIGYDDIIASVLNIVEVSIVNKNIKLVKKLQSKNVFHTYPNELKQVVLNLLKNAEDILTEKNIENPQIVVETKGNILKVSDNGGGIPKDIMPKIFDPYFSTKTKKDGTGLGLYMSKIIIEEHCRGKLSATNDQNGAVFTIQLGKNSE